MFKLPWVSRRRFDRLADELLDAERRANQIEQVARHYAPDYAQHPVPADWLGPVGGGRS